MKSIRFHAAAPVAVLVCLACSPLAALAASAPDPAPAPQPSAPSDPADLPTVVVTATRMAEPAADSASSVTVVTAKEIGERQYQTVVQALSQVPGLALSSTGTPGQTTAVLMRGMDTNQTLILIDGKRMPQDINGAFDLTNLPLDNVERIEVVRGPLSAVQGGNSGGGVINIVTKSGKGVQKPEYSVSFEAGSYNTFHEVVAARGMQGPFDYSVEASSLDTTWQRINNDYDRQNVSGNAGWQFNRDLRLSVGAGYRSSYAQNPGQAAGFPVNNGYLANDPSSWFLREVWSVDPTLEWKTTEDWTQSLSYQRSQQRDINYASPLALANFSTSTRTQIDANQFNYDTTYKIADSLQATAGTELVDRQIWVNDNTNGVLAYDNHQTNLAGNAGLDWEPVSGWKIDPSVRADAYSDYGDYIDWRVATSYRTPGTKTLLHGSYGISTTPPAESFFVAAFGQVPNFTLKPLHTEGFDAGVEQPFFGGKWTVGATYFQDDLTNAINGGIPLGGGLTTSANTNAARTQGLEASTAWHPIEALDLSGTYTYLDAKDLSNNRLLIRRPRNTATFAVTGRPCKGVALTTEGSWVNGADDFQPDSPYAIIRITDYYVQRCTASWQVNPHVQLFGRVENVWNNHFEQAYYYPEPDAAVYGGFKLTY